MIHNELRKKSVDSLKEISESQRMAKEEELKVRIGKELKERIERRMAKEERNISQITRLALQQYLDKAEKEEADQEAASLLKKAIKPDRH